LHLELTHARLGQVGVRHLAEHAALLVPVVEAHQRAVERLKVERLAVLRLEGVLDDALRERVGPCTAMNKLRIVTLGFQLRIVKLGFRTG
jgi:hypothetical protein